LETPEGLKLRAKQKAKTPVVVIIWDTLGPHGKNFPTSENPPKKWPPIKEGNPWATINPRNEIP